MILKIKEMEPQTTASETIRVILVEDDPAIRKMAAAELNLSPGIECVGAFESAEAFNKALPGLDAHIVLMDIGLPAQSGIECVRELSPLREYKDLDFVMYTQYSDREDILEAILAGASGYVLKPDSPEVIAEELRKIRAGGAPMSPKIARMVLDMFREAKSGARNIPGIEKLTPRELEVLELLLKNYSYKKIGTQLHIAEHTVRTHIKNIYRKLGPRGTWGI
jgi:DNA-binding NarL/FixJ family response regulator